MMAAQRKQFDVIMLLLYCVHKIRSSDIDLHNAVHIEAVGHGPWRVHASVQAGLRLSGSKGRGGPFGVTPAVKRTRILTREVAIIAFVHQHKPGLVLATS